MPLDTEPKSADQKTRFSDLLLKAILKGENTLTTEELQEFLELKEIFDPAPSGDVEDDLDIRPIRYINQRES